jgi:DNA repair protein RecO (recombination protein O)
MITLTDNAVLLNKRRHGERGVMVTVFTQDHGKRAGFGYSWSKHAPFQNGMSLNITWKARSDQHLGGISLESTEPFYAPFLIHPQKGMVIQMICHYVLTLLPDHDPHPDVFGAMNQAKADLLTEVSPLRVLADFERSLLAELGFACDLSRCAATGTVEDLAYISPKTGRAVSRAAGAPYHHRLFALPAFWRHGENEPSETELYEALSITGHFLEMCLLAPRSLSLPEARARMMPLLNVESVKVEAACA